MAVIGPTFFSSSFADIPPGTATFLLRHYNPGAGLAWRNVVTTLGVGGVTDTYSPSVGKITVDAADPLFGLSSADMNTGITSTNRSGSWDFGGAFDAPNWPTTGDFTAELFVKLHTANGPPENNIKGGWLYNSGGLGFAHAGNNDPDAKQNMGANSVYVTNLGAVKFAQGKGQSTGTDTLRLKLTTGDGTVSTDAWTHLAFVRKGTTWSIFSGPVGGVGNIRASGVELQASTLHSNPYLGSMWCQSRPAPSTGCFIGNLIEYRTCNVALYSGAYLVPVGPLPTTWV